MDDYADYSADEDVWLSRWQSFQTKWGWFETNYASLDAILALVSVLAPSLYDEIQAQLTDYKTERQSILSNLEAAKVGKAAAYALVDGYFSASELDIYADKNAGADREAYAITLLSKTSVTTELDAISDRVETASADVLQELSDAINAAAVLSPGNDSLAVDITALEAALEDLDQAAASVASSSIESSMVAQISAELVSGLDISAALQLLNDSDNLLTSLPSQTAFDLTASLVGVSQYQDLAAVLNDADFISLMDVFLSAKEIAREFTNYYDGEYDTLRDVVSAMEATTTFDHYLSGGFEFDQFKSDYLTNIETLNSQIDMVDALGEEAKYEAQLESLEYDRGRIDPLVVQNTSTVDYFQQLYSDVVSDFNVVVTTLESAYTFEINLFYTTITYSFDYTGDPRYTNALSARSLAYSNYVAALFIQLMLQMIRLNCMLKLIRLIMIWIL